jgi:hypothetical protein
MTIRYCLCFDLSDTVHKTPFSAVPPQAAYPTDGAAHRASAHAGAEEQIVAPVQLTLYSRSAARLRMPSRLLCNGKKQKSQETRSGLDLAPSRFISLHHIRDGI